MSAVSDLFRQKRTRITFELTDAQITKLRELMDALPLGGYADLVAPIVKALPLDHESAADSAPSADADAIPVTPLQGSRSFSIHAVTPKGEAGVAAVERVLNQIDLGEEWA